MKSKHSLVIYHERNPSPGVTHFSIGLNFKTLILVGVVPGIASYTGRLKMYHANFFLSIFTFEITVIA